MENILLSIPFMVLSTERTLSGGVSEHIATPFGAIDLRFPGCSTSERPMEPMEIEVLGDIDSWTIRDEAPQEFRRALLELVLRMVRSRWEERFASPRKVAVRFNGIRWEVGQP